MSLRKATASVRAKPQPPMRPALLRYVPQNPYIGAQMPLKQGATIGKFVIPENKEETGLDHSIKPNYACLHVGLFENLPQAATMSSSKDVKLIQTQLSWSQGNSTDPVHSTPPLSWRKPQSLSREAQNRTDLPACSGMADTSTDLKDSLPLSGTLEADDRLANNSNCSILGTSFKSSVGLSLVASETKGVVSKVLASLPATPPTGKLYSSLHALHRHTNPGFPALTVKVLNADTLDVALSILNDQTMPSSGKSALPRKPPLLLNMANAHTGGGGWLSGALAQEEALCYRTSLSFTLKKRFYPIPELGAIYSPTVVVIRDSISSGHHLLDMSDPLALPIVSVVSVAALKNPLVARTVAGAERYADPQDKQCMLEKMRLVLRVAGMRRHTKLVLGAFGCGAFANPSEEVAAMWKEVLVEREWNGWFEQIVFAVLDGGDGNWEVFENELGNLTV